MRIPTLLAIDMLLVAIALGLFLYFYYNKTESEIKQAFAPSFISIVNKSDVKTSIVWHTDVPVETLVLWGPEEFLGFRKKEGKENLVHFVTLENLKPDTQYFFKIKSGKYTFPKNALSFRTYPEVKGPILTYKPIIGTVLNQILKPVANSLVILKVENGDDLVTITSDEGIFIFPLKELKEKALNEPKVLRGETKAQIIVSFGDLKSQVQVLIPPKNEVLPPIILGQNSDFTNIIVEEEDIYDLNSDGQINSLDLAIVRNSFGKKTNNPADLNSDGIIDQKDVDLIRAQLTN